MAENKRYYWIKLKTNFFNQETIDFLLSQKNGCQYVVLYQMLCLNTANSDGALVTNINEMLVPYDVNKIVRDTKYFDFDTVSVALELFKKLGLVYEEQNGILKIANYEEMVGSETLWAEKKRMYRDKQKSIGQQERQTADNVREEYRDKSIENRDIENKKKDKKKTDSELIKSILDEVYDEDLKIALESFVESRKKMHKPLTGYAFKLAYEKLQKLSPSVSEQIEIVNQAVISGWQSFYPLKKNNNMHVKHLPDYMKEVSNNPFLDMLDKEQDT